MLSRQLDTEFETQETALGWRCRFGGCLHVNGIKALRTDKITQRVKIERFLKYEKEHRKKGQRTKAWRF